MGWQYFFPPLLLLLSGWNNNTTVVEYLTASEGVRDGRIFFTQTGTHGPTHQDTYAIEEKVRRLNMKYAKLQENKT